MGSWAWEDVNRRRAVASIFLLGWLSQVLRFGGSKHQNGNFNSNEKMERSC